MVSKSLQHAHSHCHFVSRPGLTVQVGQKSPNKIKILRLISSAGMCSQCSMACSPVKPCKPNYPRGLLLTGKPQPPVSNMPASEFIHSTFQRQKGQGQEKEARSVKRDPSPAACTPTACCGRLCGRRFDQHHQEPCGVLFKIPGRVRQEWWPNPVLPILCSLRGQVGPAVDILQPSPPDGRRGVPPVG